MPIELPRRAIDLGELLALHIRPGHRVACVGAWFGPGYDPSPLYATHLTGSGGRVHIIDSQSETAEWKEGLGNTAKEFANLRMVEEGRRDATQKPRFKWKNRMQTRMGDLPTRGHGDPLKYRKEMARWCKEHRIGLRLPAVRLADAAATRFPDKRFNVLLDIGSMQFIVDGKLVKERGPGGEHRRASEVVRELLAEYKRVSHKAIIAFRRAEMDEYGYRIRRALDEMGARFEEHEVTPDYVMAFRDGRRERLRHFYDYSHAFVVDFN